MKKLLALCSFGLVLWLAAIQFGGVQAKSNTMDDDFKVNNMKKNMRLWSGDFRPGSGKVYSGEDKKQPRLGTWCGTWLVRVWDDCKSRSGAKMWSGKFHSGDIKNLTGKFEKARKIRWNDFNDDLHKALKFLDLKSLTKEEKKSVSTTVSQTRKDLKAIYKQMKTEYLSWLTVDFTGYVDQLTNEFNWFATDLEWYVKEGNESKFEEYIKRKLKLISNFLTRKSEKK